MEKIELQEITVPIKKNKRGIKIENYDRRYFDFIERNYKESSRSKGNYRNITTTLNTWYSEEFFTQLKANLGKATTFNKEKVLNRKKIQENVDSIFLLETQYKSYHRKTVHHNSILKNILKKEYIEFRWILERELNRSSTNQNISRRFFYNRAGNYLIYIFTDPASPLMRLLTEREKYIIKSIDFKNLCRSMKTEEVFFLLCSCAVRIAYRNLIEAKNEIYPSSDDPDSFNNFMKISAVEFRNTVKFRYLYLLVSEVLKELEKKYDLEKELVLNTLSKELIEIQTQIQILKEGEEQDSIEKPDDRIGLLQEKEEKVKVEIENNTIHKDYLTLKLSSVLGFLKREKFFLETHSKFEDLEGASIILVDIFKKAFVTREYNYYTRDKEGKVRTESILVLPEGLREVHSFSDHMPRIVPPDDWEADGTLDEKNLSKVVHMGFSEPKYDKKTIDSINITQKKKFKINDMFLNLLKDINEGNLQINPNLELPFSTLEEMKKQKTLLKFLKTKLDLPSYRKNLISYFLEKETLIYSKANKKFNFFSFWEKIYEGLSNSEELKYRKLKSEVEKFDLMKAKKQIFNTMIQCGECFRGFPLYFDTYTDYRGRLYPGHYLFSRTTGFYKYLLADYKKVKLTKLGMYHLLRAYFKHDTSIFNKIEKNWTLEKAFTFFGNHNPNYQRSPKNALYFLLLEKTIISLKKNSYKTDLMIEIDQTASHAVFTSLILGNKKMALYSNLLGGDRQDINQYLMDSFEDFIQHQIEKEELSVSDQEGESKSIKWSEISKQVIWMFCNSRFLQKRTFMTFNYSQGNISRCNQLVQYISEKEVNLSWKDRKSIYKIGYNYTKFLDFCFPGFDKQLKAFVKCYKIFMKLSHLTSIRSLDGTLFTWGFYYIKKHTGSRYNPVRNKNENYTKTKPFIVKSQKKYIQQMKSKIESMRKELINHSRSDSLEIQLQKKQYKKYCNELKTFMQSVKEWTKRKERVFRPGFVHTLDGSVIRTLILRVYEKYGYHINHVHDSIQAHPNFIEDIYNEIICIYNEIGEIDLFDLFYKPSIEVLSSDEQDEFNLAVKEFLEIRENFKVHVNSCNMYPYE